MNERWDQIFRTDRQTDRQTDGAGYIGPAGPALEVDPPDLTRDFELVGLMSC